MKIGARLARTLGTTVLIAATLTPLATLDSGTAASSTATVEPVRCAAGEAAQLVLFVADDGVHGSEPWVTDGTREGTRLLRDVRPGPRGSHPGREIDGLAVVIDEVVYFTAHDGLHGRSLWRTDGTEGGTQLVADVEPHDVDGLVAVGTRLLFAVAGQGGRRWLWVSDGTAERTRPLLDIDLGSADAAAGIGILGIVEDAAYLAAYAPWEATTQAGDGRRALLIIRTDGTEEGTTVLTEVAQTPHPTGPTPGAGMLLLTAAHPSMGLGLWVSDGTPAGTSFVRAIDAIDPAYGIVWPTMAGDAVYLTADDAVHGRELWRTDGTPDGTVLVSDIRPGPGGSRPRDLTEVAGTLVFTADDGDGRRLWTSDGTQAGTVPLPGPDADRRARVHLLGVADERVIFRARGGRDVRGLWVTDGTSRGTHRIPQPRFPEWLPIDELGPPFSGEVRPGPVLLLDRNPRKPLALWRTDGTAKGTKRIAVLGGGNAGTDDIHPLGRVHGGKAFFFTHETHRHDRLKLWATDGTRAGTDTIATVDGMPSWDPQLIGIGDRRLVFGTEQGIWTSDGTEDGSLRVAETGRTTNLADVAIWSCSQE